MAVYTALDTDTLDAWLADHDVGRRVACTGIAAGIENSNFFVTTRDGDAERVFVLTLFERLSIDDLPFYLALMKHLAERDVPCPEPMPDRHGKLCSILAGKPAALVTRLAGRSIERPTAAHARAMGRALARMHEAATGFAQPQANPRGAAWLLDTAPRVSTFLDDEQRALLDGEVAWLVSGWAALTRTLPHGAIHADVFRDNVLFVESDEGVSGSPVVGGIIDFYFAGDDVFVLDLAICLNDWCIDTRTGAFETATLQAFIEAYEEVRPLTVAERESLPAMLRVGALRFWLSRLDDFHRPRPAQLLTPHDPTHFERILRRRRDEALDGIGLFASAGT
jgi:homoserine kinase type II